MKTERLSIPDVMLITPRRFEDDRGHFSETWQRQRYAEIGVDDDFVQDNHSYSAAKGVLRGLHFQLPPFAQAKLVRCLRGRILDVVVDIRTASPSFGRHVAVELNPDHAQQLYVPAGFAHGFVTLEADTEVAYKVSAYYSGDHDRTVLWNDPALGIDWGISSEDAVLSEKDRCALKLAEHRQLF